MRSGVFGSRWSGSALATLLCVAAFGLAACGGEDDSSSDNQASSDQTAAAREIARVGDQLGKAFAARDGAAACALLEPGGIKQEFGTRKACVRQMTAAMSQAKSNLAIDFDEVTVDGDTATARFKSEDGNESTYDFVKVGDTWYIDVDSESDSSEAGGQ